MTGDIKQLSVQATYWELAVCLNIILHTLIPSSGPWSFFLAAQPSLILHFDNPVLCPLCVKACPWLACLTSSSTACWPLSHCLESLAASLRAKQFPQPWTDVFFNYCGSLIMTPELICYFLISLVCLRSTVILSRWWRIWFFRSDFLWTPLEVSTTATGVSSHLYCLQALAEKTALLRLTQSPAQCSVLLGQV